MLHENEDRSFSRPHILKCSRSYHAIEVMEEKKKKKREKRKGPRER